MNPIIIPKSREVKLPQYLKDIQELPKFIQENNLRLFSKEDTTIVHYQLLY